METPVPLWYTVWLPASRVLYHVILSLCFAKTSISHASSELHSARSCNASLLHASMFYFIFLVFTLSLQRLPRRRVRIRTASPPISLDSCCRFACVCRSLVIEPGHKCEIYFTPQAIILNAIPRYYHLFQSFM